MDRLPPLVALRAFEVVGKSRSIRQAAAYLSVDHTVVSRHIRNLESWLGIILIERSASGILLTPQGTRYFERISDALRSIAVATHELNPLGLNGELRIWCVAGLAVGWLIPRLRELQALLPHVQIALRPTRDRPNLAHEEAHIEIRYGSRGERGIREFELAVPKVFPVASPDYLAGKPRPADIADLTRMVLIHENTQEHWRSWLNNSGCNAADLELQGPRVWDANVALEAAIAGAGVALTNDLIAGPAMARGALSQILPSNIQLEPYVFHVPADNWNRPVIVKFREWLVAEFKKSGYR